MELSSPVLEFAFRMRLEFPRGDRLRFQPEGMGHRRGFVPVADGTIEGPLLTGRVVPGSGGDWPRLWEGGLIEFEAHYMLEAADSTPIYIHNRGLAHAGPDAIAAVERGERPAAAPYCRVAPRFEAPDGVHGWLNRRLFVGTGERHGDSSVFEYYVVQ